MSVAIIDSSTLAMQLALEPRPVTLISSTPLTLSSTISISPLLNPSTVTFSSIDFTCDGGRCFDISLGESVRMEGCSFTGSGVENGGITVDNGNLFVVSSTFEYLTTPDSGAAIQFLTTTSSLLQVTESNFTSCTSTASGGGAISFTSETDTLTVEESTFNKCVASSISTTGSVGGAVWSRFEGGDGVVGNVFEECYACSYTELCANSVLQPYNQFNSFENSCATPVETGTVLQNLVCAGLRGYPSGVCNPVYNGATLFPDEQIQINCDALPVPTVRTVTTRNGSNNLYWMIAGGVGLLLGLIIGVVTRRKKKEEDEDSFVSDDDDDEELDVTVVSSPIPSLADSSFDHSELSPPGVFRNVHERAPSYHSDASAPQDPTRPADEDYTDPKIGAHSNESNTSSMFENILQKLSFSPGGTKIIDSGSEHDEVGELPNFNSDVNGSSASLSGGSGVPGSFSWGSTNNTPTYFGGQRTTSYSPTSGGWFRKKGEEHQERKGHRRKSTGGLPKEGL